MFCVKCGNKTKANEKFCDSCGAAIRHRVPTAGGFQPKSGSFIPKKLKTMPLKKQLITVGGLLAAVIIVIVLLVNIFGGHPLIGKWEDSSSDWYYCRIIFNRNGTGKVEQGYLNDDYYDETEFFWDNNKDAPNSIFMEMYDSNGVLSPQQRVTYRFSKHIDGGDVLVFTGGGYIISGNFRRVK